MWTIETIPECLGKDYKFNPWKAKEQFEQWENLAIPLPLLPIGAWFKDISGNVWCKVEQSGNYLVVRNTLNQETLFANCARGLWIR